MVTEAQPIKKKPAAQTPAAAEEQTTAAADPGAAAAKPRKNVSKRKEIINNVSRETHKSAGELKRRKEKRK